jgi:hypothetical protein
MMSEQDFQRNFGQSYFGLVLDNPQVRLAVAQTGVGLDSIEISPNGGTYIPCTYPRKLGAGQWALKGVAKLREGVYKPLSLMMAMSLEQIDDINFMWTGVPLSTMVQVDEVAVYLRRRPLRETPRGYNPKAITPFTYGAEHLATLDMGPAAPQLVWSLYNPTIFSVQEAMSILGRGDRAACMIGRHLALGYREGRSNIQIFYRGTGAIGFVEMYSGSPALFPETCTIPVIEYVSKIFNTRARIK